MKKRFLVIISSFVISLIMLPEGFTKSLEISDKTRRVVKLADSLTLFDCYRLALKQSETVAKQGELIKEAEAHFIQALSVVMPSVSFVATEGRQDTASAGFSKSTRERKFVFKQNLFTGFKEIAGTTGSKVERTQYVQAKIRAEQMLFSDVSDAFYLFLEQEKDLAILKTIRGALQSRIKELKKWEELGRSRRSERASVQVQMYQVSAEIESAKRRVQVTRELLEFLTGVSITTVSDAQSAFPRLMAEEYYVAKAPRRADVAAAQAAWEVAKKKVIIARSGFFPTVTLEGNYYVSRDTAPTDSDWDAALKADIPIFDWTQSVGDVKEANAKAKESEFDLQRTKRLAATDIREAYAMLTGSIAQEKALIKALNAATTNYLLQEEDYRLNLVNNLDVLAAIRTFAETKLDCMRSLYETKRLYWQLCVATGELPQEAK